MTATADPVDQYIAEIGPLRFPTTYCPYWPTAKQEYFLRRPESEAFFGGAAGPGKSWGLLMAALQYVDIPGYHALLLRPSLQEFEQPGSLIEVAHDWLDLTDAAWHGSKREWTFPSGATIRFGYLRNTGHLAQYKGPSYSFGGFDELTSFPEQLYRGMFRILRQPRSLENVPLRMFSASNPGDIGHSWVKSRFIDPDSREPGVGYVPAKITDNPFLDVENYIKTSLSHMSPIDQQRLIDGDWDVMEEGGKFHRDNFVVIDKRQVADPERAVRYWDLAASTVSPSNSDPDYTCGVRLQVDRDGLFTITDIVHGRYADADVESIVRATAEQDGTGVDVYVEQEPGASGKLVVSHFKRKVLDGYTCFAGLPRGGDKEVRARPVAAAVANGLVSVVRQNEHLRAFLDECTIFPNGSHDDFVDALSGAHTKLTERPKVRMRSGVARGTIAGLENYGGTTGGVLDPYIQPTGIG